MPSAAPHPSKARAARAPVVLGGLLLGALGTAALPACTHDFSVFEVNAAPPRDGSAPNGEDGSFGGSSDSGGTGSGSGGRSGSGGSGGIGTAGATSTGGSQSTGGVSSAGGASNTGGKSSSGGASGTGGKPSTGGTSNTGGAQATGGRSGTGGAGGLRPCAQKYGAASGYVLCTETATTCRFYANTANSTCGALCTGLSGTCFDQDNDNGVDPCTVGDATDTCATARQNAICVCSR